MNNQKSKILAGILVIACLAALFTALSGPVLCQIPYSAGDAVIRGTLIGAFPLTLVDPVTTQRPGGFSGPVSIRALNESVYILNLPEFQVQRIDQYAPRGTVLTARLPFTKIEGKLKNLPLDMDFDESGDLWVLDTRAKLLLKFDYKGRILKSINLSKICKMPLKFSCLSRQRFLVRDVSSEKVILLNESGALIKRLPGVCTEVSTDNRSALVFGFPKLRTRLSLYTMSFQNSDLTPLTVIKTPLPVINAMALGVDKDNILYVYAVMGKYEDMAEKAFVYAIKNRILLGSAQVPESPGYGTNRFMAVKGRGKIVMNHVFNDIYHVQEFEIPLKTY